MINEFDAIGKRLIYREVSFKRVPPNRLARVICDFPRQPGAFPERNRTGESPLLSWPRDLNHRQGKAQPQFVFEINLDVMHPVLLELHAAKVMDVGRVAFHFL